MPSRFFLAAVVGAAFAIAATPLRAPARQRPDPVKHLVLDARVIEKTMAARLVLGPVQKAEENPLLLADRPWENALNNLYPNVAYDAEAGLFKMWYKCVLVDGDVIAQMRPPRTTHDVGWYLCHATSKDGVTWEKPELGLVDHAGSTRNNIVVRDAPNVGVFHDPSAAAADQRYKLVSDVGSGKMRTRFSPDGLRWSEPVEPRGLGHTGDTHNNAFWDDRLGKYVLFTRYYFGERLVARSESQDFVTWETPRVVMRSTIAEGKDRQCYCMPVFPYASGYLGFLMMYNVGADRTVDCELAWSEDSVTWRRVLPGQPFIPRGGAGGYDAGCVYAQAGPPILRRGRLHIYYGGGAGVHKDWKRHCLPCLARLRVDGFAGYEPAAADPGLVFTHPVLCTERPLTVSADARGGTLRVEVLDEEGFSAEACEPLAADVTDAEVRWRGGKSLADLKGRAARLRFVLEKARLYAFGGVRAIEAPVIRPEARAFDKPLLVTMEVPAGATGVVRYTLDGGEPTADSTEYRVPLAVSDTTELRARLFPPDVRGGGPVRVARFVRRTPWEQANPGARKNPVEHRARFDRDVEGWRGVDGVERVATDDSKRGHLRVTRAGQAPFVFADAKASGGVFTGDIEKRFGGSGVEIAFEYRAANEAAPMVELFAADIAPWTFRAAAGGTDWNTIRAPLRYDWSDAEAEAAGWRPAPHAFSWQETIRTVGRVVIVQRPSPAAGSFDLDEFRVTTRFE